MGRARRFVVGEGVWIKMIKSALVSSFSLPKSSFPWNTPLGKLRRSPPTGDCILYYTQFITVPFLPCPVHLPQLETRSCRTSLGPSSSQPSGDEVWPQTGGLFGELLANEAQRRRLSGLVIDGNCRDTPLLRQRLGRGEPTGETTDGVTSLFRGICPGGSPSEDGVRDGG